MKIAYLVTRSDTIGGSHVHVRDLASAMQSRGHHVAVFIGGKGPVSQLYSDVGLEVVEISSLKRNIAPSADLRAYIQLKKRLKELSPDLISAHSSKAGFLGRYAARSLQIPVVFTAHGWSFTEGKSAASRFIYRFLEKKAAPKSDRIITVSEFDRKLALEKLRVPEHQVVTIYNGMPDLPDQTVNSESTSDGYEDTPVRIVKIARFDKQKDHLELIEAVKELDNIHLDFIGDGPGMIEVQQRLKEYELSDKTTFRGQVERDEVANILNEADIFTLISNWEGFPRSTLEAMRAGLPVIVSDVGGAGEAVEDGVTGFIVPKGDIKKLRSMIGELIENGEKRLEMGKSARQRFEKLYSFDQMFKKTYSVYMELMTPADESEKITTAN